MISRWSRALIFSIVLILSCSSSHAGEVIGEVNYSGTVVIMKEQLHRTSLLREGEAFSDSLLGKELLRVDSLYFSYGLLAVTVTVDTIRVGEVVDVQLEISEGEQTTIGSASVSGSGLFDPSEAAAVLRVKEGIPFDPVRLEGSMLDLLRIYNNSGYPYAQVWLTGFIFRERANVVDLSFSVFEGERAVISNVIFEGLSKTDTSFALRTSRLRPGSDYNEGYLNRAREYLRTSDIFESVQDVRIERRERGKVDVVIPVKEKERTNAFQGAFGFSRKDGGDYILNGSVLLELRNIAGKGRNALFNWLNNGEKYSKVEFQFNEPFLFSLPVHLDGEVKQVIQDTLYTWHSAGLYFRFPLKPGFSILTGAAVDRNVPGQIDLLRSIRQRYRLGLEKQSGPALRFELHAEGAFKRNYFRDNGTESEGQFLYRFDGAIKVPSFGNQSIYCRLVSEAVFSLKDIPPAERFPLGGAETLRGYRENQYRGERIVYSNIEYRFGEEGRLFLFDDVGAFYRAGESWTVKNGVGFGLRSASPLGTVVLSFGVGDRLSLEGTRIHISLRESF